MCCYLGKFEPQIDDMIYNSTQLENYQSGVFEEMPALPDDAKSRYEIFKEYIGKFYLYSELYFYLMDALREDDIHSITAAIFEIEATRKDNRLLEPRSRAHLYREGRRYVAQLVKNPAELENYDSRQLILMICVLFENDYFDSFVLPDEAFEIGGPAPHLEILGEVYGKYFAFYKYLQRKQKECEAALDKTVTERTDKPEDDKEAPVLTFKDTFLFIHKDKFDAIIESLGKLLPDTILNKYEELKRLDGPIIYEKEKGYALNGLLPRQPSYLAGLYRVCLKNGWVGKQHSLETIKDALALTFTTELNTLTAFKKALSQDHVPKYSEPFRMLFETIK